MKLKHLKKAHNALSEMILKSKTLPKGTTFFMNDAHCCAFAILQGERWNSYKVDDLFGLPNLSEQLNTDIENLFLGEPAYWKDPYKVTPKQWRKKANKVLKTLAKKISKKEFAKTAKAQ